MDCWGWFFFFLSSAVCASHQPGQLFWLSRSLSRFSVCNPVSRPQCIRLNMSLHKVPTGQFHRSLRQRYRQSVMTQGSFASLSQEHVSRQTSSPLFCFVLFFDCLSLSWFLFFCFFKYKPSTWFPFCPPALAHSFSRSRKAGPHNVAAWVVLHFRELKG